MSNSDQKHVPIYKPDSEKSAIIINHVILMLSRRIYIDRAGEKHPILDYDVVRKKVSDDGNNVYTFKASNGDEYAVKIIFQPILATGKQSIVNEFIKENDDYKKIIIAKDYNKKIIEFVTRNGSQIFEEDFFLSDIINQKFQPIFEPLSPKEMSEIKKEYNISSYTAPNLTRSDPMTKYFGLKKGDLIRVINGSPLSGYAISYQVVN